MGRPDSVVGLAVELVRRRGVPRWTRGAVGAAAVVTALVVLSRAREPQREAAPSAELLAWRTAPVDAAVIFIDPAVVATEHGWLVAWTRWERGDRAIVQVAALDRAGGVRGETRRVSPADAFARMPTLARSGTRVAVVWTSSSDVAWSPRPRLAVVDADAKVVVPALWVGDEEENGFEASVASDGQGWGVAWKSWAPGRQGLALARLTPDGAPRGPVTRVTLDHVGLDVDLAWTGDAWLAPVATYDYERDRSALHLHWFDRGGSLIGSRREALSRGEVGPLQATARGATAWITWGDDTGFGIRHDPRFAAVEDRRVVAGPVALGPRRSGSIPTLACAAAACTAAWVSLPEDGDAHATLHVQVLDRAGVPRGAARRIGPRASVDRRRGVAIASSLDERESLAVWSVRQGDDLRLMVVRLGPDGGPLAPPAVFPLP